MSSKVKDKWNKIEQDDLFEIKIIVAHDTLFAYMDFNEEFNIHTDARKLQLGAVISHNGKPISFYIRKLTDDQKGYTVTEKELLSIVETLTEFRTILLGQVLIIYTDHKNLTCIWFNTDRGLRWGLIIKEYGMEV